MAGKRFRRLIVGLVLNPPMRAEFNGRKVSFPVTRRDWWNRYMPVWVKLAFTRREACGCQFRRGTGRRVIVCAPHAIEYLNSAAARQEKKAS